jgi:hypothetical protein
MTKEVQNHEQTFLHNNTHRKLQRFSHALTMKPPTANCSVLTSWALAAANPICEPGRPNPQTIPNTLDLSSHSGDCEQFSVFWDIMLCSAMKVNQHFRGTYCLHLQGQRGSQWQLLFSCLRFSETANGSGLVGLQVPS